MKTLLMLVCAAGLLTAAEDASLSGKWQIHSSIAGNDNDQDCNFTQKDKDLTGTCTSTTGTVDVTGKIDGKKVIWSYKSDYNGGPLTVNFEGTVSADNKIAGTVNVPEYSVDGDFTATQSK